MSNIVFQSKKFVLNGIIIPDFELISGKIIKVCVPNFDAENNVLGHKFSLSLLERFQNKSSKLVWVKEYSETGFMKFLKSISVGDFIKHELKIDSEKAKSISEYLQLNFDEKVKNLIIGKRKALAIKCNFEKYNTLIFDYYGVGASEIDYLEKIVDSEIIKGKSAIIIDRLEFQDENEICKNVESLVIMGTKTRYT